ncbi:MAG: LpxL/LpxP family Kdo(2)-lipid IV(A) lauroyl/palmitoleoyl acyltransferase [Sulfuriflexus sp.]|nr:LpxL/LpxP family Kdo(2)-lipid IV(A) lauroyl/palmitoleoyl acyltransferase [Sulfuriflexus sp.]
MWLVAMLPYRVQMALGSLVGWFMHTFARERRTFATINLELCFPEQSAIQRKQLLRKHFDALGKGMIETAIAWWTPASRLKKLHSIKGLEHLDAALGKGKGVILLGAHFTTLEIGARLLALHRSYTAMYREHNNPLFDAIMRQRRESYFAGTHERKDVRGTLRSLKANKAVWYAADQDYGRAHSVFAPFFGVPAALITATARLAKLSGAPVVPFFQTRREDGSGYDLHLLPPLENFPSDDDVADATAINHVIEEEIRQQPSQYLWVHRRFKTRPEGMQRPYPPRKRRVRRKKGGAV